MGEGMLGFSGVTGHTIKYPATGELLHPVPQVCGSLLSLLQCQHDGKRGTAVPYIAISASKSPGE